MTNSRRVPRPNQSAPNDWTSGRPVVYGKNGVISSGHYLTSMAGMRMMLAGGNAFDAMVAAGFTAAVTEPTAAYSIAAEGVFMLYHWDSGDLLALSGQGTAPGRATAEWYRAQGHEAIPTGPGLLAPLAFTVPGIVHGFLTVLERYGTMTVGEVLAPAIQYADQGFPNYEYMLKALRAPSTISQFKQFPPGGIDIFYDDGRLPAPGSMLVQKALGSTLNKLVYAEKVASGGRAEGIMAARDMFYGGEVAKSIAEGSQQLGGLLDLADLASYESRFETPVKTSFAGHEIHCQSTWTQAPVMLQTLNILEHFNLKDMGHNSAAYVHTLAEAIKLAMADRQAYYGDPEYAAVPIDGLLSKEYAAKRATLIDPDKAYPEQPPPGDPWRYSRLSGAPRTGHTASVPASDGGGDEAGTTHISVIDGNGNMACVTPSGGSFDKSVFFSELGCAISTRIEMFNLEDHHPNQIHPGKRPRTTLVNYIVTRECLPVMTLGCPGGDHQVQGNLQLLLNTLLWGMNPQQAVEAPRFATQSIVNSFYPHIYCPGQLAVENTMPAKTVDQLVRLGHRITTVASAGMGATVSRRDPETGVLSSSGDPRRACYAVAW